MAIRNDGCYSVARHWPLVASSKCDFSAGEKTNRLSGNQQRKCINHSMLNAHDLFVCVCKREILWKCPLLNALRMSNKTMTLINNINTVHIFLSWFYFHPLRHLSSSITFAIIRTPNEYLTICKIECIALSPEARECVWRV